MRTKDRGFGNIGSVSKFERKRSELTDGTVIIAKVTSIPLKQNKGAARQVS